MGATYKFTHTDTFQEMACGACGIVFYVPQWFYSERWERGAGWTCPNGHNRVFSESEVDKLKKELEAERRRLEIAKNEAARVSAQHAQEVKKRMRLEKRIRNGVCLECNRSFPNLRRHMQTKHKVHEEQ